MKRRSILCAINAQEREEFLPGNLWAGLQALPLEFEYLPMPLAKDDDLAGHLARSGAEVLVSCWSTPGLPEDLPVCGENQLKYVCHLTGTVRNLIPRALIERGLKVTNWGASASRTVAEAGLLLMMCALRRGGYWIASMHRDGGWKDSSKVVTESLFERCVGLHGFGAISRELTSLLRPFGVKISTFSPSVDDRTLALHGVKRAATLEELFASNDIVVELAPLTPKTRHMVNEQLLRSIRPGGVFVNIGRGAVVDESALVRVAAQGKIQVALDVFEKEPLPADSPLRGMPNVTLFPHIAGPTNDRRRDCGAAACRNLELYCKGMPLESEITLDIYDRST